MWLINGFVGGHGRPDRGGESWNLKGLVWLGRRLREGSLDLGLRWDDGLGGVAR
jgi:hypothetical protein